MMKSSAPALELGTERAKRKGYAGDHLGLPEIARVRSRTGRRVEQPEPVVERIANRLQLERALRALRAEGLHADHMN